MNIYINHRGNGTCPNCRYRDDCSIHTTLTDTLGKKGKHKQTEMEIVIYSCPYYTENN
jgi:hypothetical protein